MNNPILVKALPYHKSSLSSRFTSIRVKGTIQIYKRVNRSGGDPSSIVTSDFFESKKFAGDTSLSKNPLPLPHAKWRVRKTRLYRGSSKKKWRGARFFFLKTRCRRVRCTSRWQFCTCRIKRSVFIRRKLFQGMRQLFSRRGGGEGPWKETTDFTANRR